MSKRSANSSPSKRPSKRSRPTAGGIGATSQADDTSRLIASHHSQEHAGGGSSYLSTRDLNTQLSSLGDVALRAAAGALLDVVRIQRSPILLSKHAQPDSRNTTKFGWDPTKRKAILENGNGPNASELDSLRSYVLSLPTSTSNRLLSLLLTYSTHPTRNPEGLDNSRLSKLFFHSNLTFLSLSQLGPTSILLSKLPDCTTLTDLDLSSNTALSDNMLKGVLGKLGSLERVCLRGCTKVGDESLVALSRATGERLKEVNLSMTAVTVKGLISLLSRCSALEVLKLANVQGLNEKAITKLVEESICPFRLSPSLRFPSPH
ncbi:hypothetical protein P7C70_g4622, partial [Phenoliferia sp. Uapishka_3]